MRLTILVGIMLMVKGASGLYVLGGTNSSGALIAFGAMVTCFGIYKIIEAKKEAVQSEDTPPATNLVFKTFTINQRGSIKGPLALHELKTMLANGKLHPTDLYTYEGMGDWRPIGEISEKILTL
jgi:hypothetical protein